MQKSIIIWGNSPIVQEHYLTFLKETNYKCEVIVDTYCFGGAIDGISIISSMEYIEQIEKYRTLPIVITAMTETLYLYYSKVVEEIIYEFNLTGIDILYPSFLGKNLALDFKNKPFIVGFPGSGNTLLLKIVNELYSYSLDKKHKTDLISLLSKKCSNHIKDMITDQFNINDISNILFANHDPLHEVCFFGYRNDIGFIPKVPTNSFLHEKNINITHSILSNEDLIRYNRYNYFMVFAIRHPLDMLISNIFKIQHTMASFIINENETTDEFRNNIGYLRLNNNKYFKFYVKQLVKYLTNYLENKHHYYEIRYEKWFESPIDEIKNIANKLHTECDEKKAKLIWDKLGFKNFGDTDEYHYFSPSIGKWKKYLSPEHIKIIYEEGLDSIVNSLNYSMDNDFSAFTSCNTDKLYYNKNYNRYIKAYQHYLDILYNKKNKKDFTFYCSSKRLSNKLFNIFENKIIDKSFNGFSQENKNARS